MSKIWATYPRSANDKIEEVRCLEYKHRPLFMIWTKGQFNISSWLIGFDVKRNTDGSGRYKHATNINVHLACLTIMILVTHGKRDYITHRHVPSFSEVMGRKTQEDNQ